MAFILRSPLAMFAVLFAACVPQALAADPEPNVVFILADDLGYRELGSFGQKLIRTPNLDALARQGMRLTQHYCGNAVCAPSRCVVLPTVSPPGRFGLPPCPRLWPPCTEL